MIDQGHVWGLPLLAFILCATVTPLVRRWVLTKDLVDQPGPRRSHFLPTPRGGGLAVIGAMLAVMVAGWGLPELRISAGFAILVGLVGWLDDRGGLRVSFRLVTQVLLVGLFVLVVGPIESVELGSRVLHWPLLWTVLGALAAVWVINLHNFMDGSDGLAAMQAIWSGSALGFLLLRSGEPAGGIFGLALAAGFAGFLIWNRPSAKIFMGDSGSMLLGSGIAALLLLGAASGAISIWVGFIVTSVFVVDATATLAVRLFKGEQWYTAHRQHAYQRLVVSGWGHGRVLALYAALHVFLVLPLTGLAVWHPQLEFWLAAGLALIFTAAWWTVQVITTEK